MSSEEIFGAIAAGEMERARDLVAQDASCAAARNEQGISALMWALYNSRSDMADVALDAASGVDVFEAAALERTETLSELIAEDATLVGAWLPDGFTALHLAAFFGHVARRADDGQGALDLAEVEGHDEMVALLKAV